MDQVPGCSPNVRHSGEARKQKVENHPFLPLMVMLSKMLETLVVI